MTGGCVNFQHLLREKMCWPLSTECNKEAGNYNDQITGGKNTIGPFYWANAPSIYNVPI